MNRLTSSVKKWFFNLKNCISRKASFTITCEELERVAKSLWCNNANDQNKKNDI